MEFTDDTRLHSLDIYFANVRRWTKRTNIKMMSSGRCTNDIVHFIELWRCLSEEVSRTEQIAADMDRHNRLRLAEEWGLLDNHTEREVLAFMEECNIS